MRRQPNLWILAVVAGIIGTIALMVSAPTMTLAASGVASVKFEKCTGGHRTACVIDGDTLWIEGTKIRIADIDAPEISEPKCASELALGDRATDRLVELVNQGPLELQAWPGRDKDRYGRALRVLVRNGHSLGDILVSEGLARTWAGRREPWC
ncbi:thermonuclease family protein [Rhizobium ruizarguesonis]|uniref:thermonuclease family protein n=1 Tax=Rhizobium ruizarguesonis TaxID=2081791 RepID=UPI00103017A6|nr:thermonuclease family protein [Rhizobium ruizarguesonis]TAU57454.1 thermonuclease family protein [Rhizobium ruizarguesonis]